MVGDGGGDTRWPMGFLLDGASINSLPLLGLVHWDTVLASPMPS
jgi:hypothetical protein